MSLYVSELSFYNYCHSVLARVYRDYYRVSISECMFFIFRNNDLALCQKFLEEIHAMRFKGSHKKFNHELNEIKKKYIALGAE